jgi:LysR family hydrogen peroxide-inducible transcriptional activator
MNFQQLEYIVALEKHKNFVAAAAACFVSQPTLSMMVKKLEEELEIVIVRRGVHPLEFTEEGMSLLNQAKRILAEQQLMREISKELTKGIEGQIRISVIPSLATTVIPSFIQNIEKSSNALKVSIVELPTERALIALQQGDIDMAILATDSDPQVFSSYPVYEEEFVAYVSPLEKMPKRKFIQSKHITSENLWFLSEEHCFREQALEVCSFKKKKKSKVTYDAGSLQTLIRLVDENGGITLLPAASIQFLSTKQRANVREFAPPVPMRLVQLTTLQDYPRKKVVEFLLEALKPSLT